MEDQLYKKIAVCGNGNLIDKESLLKMVEERLDPEYSIVDRRIEIITKDEIEEQIERINNKSLDDGIHIIDTLDRIDEQIARANKMGYGAGGIIMGVKDLTWTSHHISIQKKYKNKSKMIKNSRKKNR